MLWRVIEEEVVPTSSKEGISQIVWSPLAQGVLTGKYLPGQQPPADSRGGHAEAGQDDAADAHRRHPDPGAAARPIADDSA
jgi:aryl-alcohol dehydrogenase-like predicted oxidoreductase